MDERIAFGPKALSRFTNIIKEVAVELGEDGVLLRSTEMRTRLAQRLFGLARFWWTDTQIKATLAEDIAQRGLGFPDYAAARVVQEPAPPRSSDRIIRPSRLRDLFSKTAAGPW